MKTDGNFKAEYSLSSVLLLFKIFISELNYKQEYSYLLPLEATVYFAFFRQTARLSGKSSVA